MISRLEMQGNVGLCKYECQGRGALMIDEVGVLDSVMSVQGKEDRQDAEESL